MSSLAESYTARFLSVCGDLEPTLTVVALSFVLLAGGGLFIRTLGGPIMTAARPRLTRENSGVRRQELLIEKNL